jgi:hypothetical protein
MISIVIPAHNEAEPSLLTAEIIQIHSASGAASDQPACLCSRVPSNE